MYFQKPGRNSKNSKKLEEIQKTWSKFPKIFMPPRIIQENRNIYIFSIIKLEMKTYNKNQLLKKYRSLWFKLVMYRIQDPVLVPARSGHFLLRSGSGGS